MKRSVHPREAFTLIEILVVVGLIALLLVLALPAFNSINSGRTLDVAGQTIADQIALARQIALSKNRSVEVRFMKVKRETDTTSSFAALQLNSIGDDGSDTPLGKTIKLPERVFISDDTTLSSLLATGVLGQLDTAALPDVPGLGKPDEVRFFRFRPSGRTDLPSMSGNYYLTVLAEKDRGKTPDNFSTIQVDPMNGRVRTLRP